MSQNSLQSLNKINIDEKNSSIIFSMLYESLRQILEAIGLMEGYKVYSHEAFTYYLNNKKEYKIANLFDKYRKMRNGVNYYGKTISRKITLKARKEIKILCELLKYKYLNFK